MMLVRVNIRVEHFNYAPHAKDFYLEIVASLFIIGSYATVRMVKSVTGSETICHAVGSGRLSFGTRSATIWPNKKETVRIGNVW